jgi:CheY-like chemotaxis protein
MQGLPFPILLVDDDEDDRIIIDEAFTQIGCQAHIKKFINGKALLDYLEKIDPSTFPSLIVLDNTLPAPNAIDVLSILKSNSRLKSIPVIVYTSSLPPSKKERLLAKGAFACIEKGSTAKAIIGFAKDLRDLAKGGSKESFPNSEA